MWHSQLIYSEAGLCNFLSSLSYEQVLLAKIVVSHKESMYVVLYTGESGDVNDK